MSNICRKRRLDITTEDWSVLEAEWCLVGGWVGSGVQQIWNLPGRVLKSASGGPQSATLQLSCGGKTQLKQTSGVFDYTFLHNHDCPATAPSLPNMAL